MVLSIGFACSTGLLKLKIFLFYLLVKLFKFLHDVFSIFGVIFFFFFFIIIIMGIS